MGRIITSVLDDDEFTDTKQLFHYDLDDDSFVIETTQGSANRRGALDAIVDLSKATFNSIDERARWRGDGALNHVANIPMIFLHQHPELMYDDEALKKWVNDPDNRCFRSRPGKI